MKFNRTFGALIIILGFAAGFLYYNQVASSSQEVLPPVPVNVNDNLGSFKDFTLNFEFLSEAQYKNLKTFGEFPVSIGTPGKKDIFAPF